MLRRHLTITAGIVLLGLTACSASGNEVTTTSGTPTSTTVAETTTTTTAGTTTTQGTTTTTTSDVVADQTVTMLVSPFTDMGDQWTSVLFPYGETEDTLGTSPGGDGGSVLWGPEYRTQTPDGTWWFLDAAKLRIAHFADDGSYIDQVPMPDSLLAQGIYFQYQMPQALDDGSVVMSGYGRPFVRIADGTATGTPLADSIPFITTDGTVVYGADVESGGLLVVDPANPAVTPVEWFTKRNGERYRASVRGTEVFVEMPDAVIPMTRTLELRSSEDPSVPAHGAIEVESGIDGSLYILFYGAAESDETKGVGAFVTIGPDGVVSEAEQIVDPFSPSDPGSPAHLGVTPGTSTPWLMRVAEDGVRVYTRAG